MYRWTGTVGATPMVASSRPNAPAVSPFTVEPVVTTVIIAMPRMAMRKYCGEPNSRTSSTRMGEMRMSTTTAMVPPNAEATAEMTSDDERRRFENMGRITSTDLEDVDLVREVRFHDCPSCCGSSVDATEFGTRRMGHPWPLI